MTRCASSSSAAHPMGANRRADHGTNPLGLIGAQTAVIYRP